MQQPNSPQAALRLQNVVLALLVVIVLLEVGVVVLAFLLGRHVNWWGFPSIPVGVVCLVVLTPAAVWAAVTARRSIAAHVLPAQEHRCQCLECGRTFSPDGPATPGAGRPGQTPQELIRSANALLVTLPVVLVLSLAAMVFSLLNPTRDAELFPLLTVVNLGLLAFLALLAAVLILAMLRRRARARETLSRLGPDHGCACRWCHARGSVVLDGVG